MGEHIVNFLVEKNTMSSTAIALIGVLVLGWLLASIFGTWAYFANQDR
ncbi:hypothetical protein M595_1452 [Lyngbya aestuarii BL J]|uniref:Uncharacterized protein n=1 Tax=Lyngbya aestuarii BL J TaxID=1348334 RepID=U7QKT5_9CYAN|nr:hypothetical protein M595_1452 [Lyngbya aestuarii BL J]